LISRQVSDTTPPVRKAQSDVATSHHAQMGQDASQRGVAMLTLALQAGVMSFGVKAETLPIADALLEEALPDGAEAAAGRQGAEYPQS
jgi:hypothetical protein